MEYYLYDEGFLQIIIKSLREKMNLLLTILAAQ